MLGLQPVAEAFLANKKVYLKMIHKILFISYFAALMEAPGAALPLVSISLGAALPSALVLEARSPIGGT